MSTATVDQIVSWKQPCMTTVICGKDLLSTEFKTKHIKERFIKLGLKLQAYRLFLDRFYDDGASLVW